MTAADGAALNRFAGFSDTWERRYPAIVRLWTDAWAELVPFLHFGIEPNGDQVRVGEATAAVGDLLGRLGGRHEVVPGDVPELYMDE